MAQCEAELRSDLLSAELLLFTTTADLIHKSARLEELVDPRNAPLSETAKDEKRRLNLELSTLSTRRQKAEDFKSNFDSLKKACIQGAS